MAPVRRNEIHFRAGFAGKGTRETFERRHDRDEILALQIGPLIEVDGGIGLVTVLCRSPISLCHVGFEREWANAAEI